MIWRTILKKDLVTSKPVTRSLALSRALSSVDFSLWHNTEQSIKTKFAKFSRLKAAVYEENYHAFTVEDRGRAWFVILR